MSTKSAYQWRRCWRAGGHRGAGLEGAGRGGVPAGAGPDGAPGRELERGPLAHGWPDQRWTLARIKTLIGRLFHVSYTVEGTWLLLRNGWSWQQPARRAIERDEDAVELWKKEVWPQVKRPRRRPGPGSVFEDEAGQSMTPPRPHLGPPRRPRWRGSVDVAPAGSRWQA